jgi:hypothetical protein
MTAVMICTEDNLLTAVALGFTSMPLPAGMKDRRFTFAKPPHSVGLTCAPPFWEATGQAHATRARCANVTNSFGMYVPKSPIPHWRHYIPSAAFANPD